MNAGQNVSSQMQQAAAGFQTDPKYPPHNARNHYGSLVGKTVTVAPEHSNEFEQTYSKDGLKADQHYTITKDNEAINPNKTQQRYVSFADKRGNIYSGNATRFNFAATGAPPPSDPPAIKKGYVPDVARDDIMKRTREFLR